MRSHPAEARLRDMRQAQSIWHAEYEVFAIDYPPATLVPASTSRSLSLLVA
jgi:hypothetical protein